MTYGYREKSSASILAGWMLIALATLAEFEWHQRGIYALLMLTAFLFFLLAHEYGRRDKSAASNNTREKGGATIIAGLAFFGLAMVAQFRWGNREVCKLLTNIGVIFSVWSRIQYGRWKAMQVCKEC